MSSTFGDSLHPVAFNRVTDSNIVATDTLITLASTYFLLIAREKALALTRKLIRDLIKICFQTALPATTALRRSMLRVRMGLMQIVER